MTHRRTDREVNVSESSFWMTTYEEHGSAVMAFLTSRTGRRDLAEDLLQETFVRAIRARPTLPNPAGVRSYLFTTAHRLLLSRHRRKRPTLFSEVSEQQAHALEQMADDKATAPDSAADLSRFEDRLHDVLGQLKPAHRSAFELAVLQQMPYSDVAREQGWTVAQVKTNVHRARKQVMTALGDMLGTGLENRP
jgi:RNA polymerase sigma-70 factor (ECF subfamily)